MAYNNGREDRKWRIWKEAEEKVLREHGVDETTIEQIRIDARADFNSNNHRGVPVFLHDFLYFFFGLSAHRNDSSLLRSVLPALPFWFERCFSAVSWIWFKQSSMWAERFSIPSAYFSRFRSSVICSVTPFFSSRSVSFSAGEARRILFCKCRR